ncbi:MAG: hypothetical protein N2316_08405 [Spirochaetes bacterium]|nr:hypothetical protein [Spirochaetota bacterium]
MKLPHCIALVGVLLLTSALYVPFVRAQEKDSPAQNSVSETLSTPSTQQEKLDQSKEDLSAKKQEKTSKDAQNIGGGNTAIRTENPKGKIEEHSTASGAHAADQTELFQKAGGLLELEEGDFLYSRIPEKKISTHTLQTQDAFVAEVGGHAEESPDASQRKGLFGLSAKATDYFAKGFLLFIVLLILILYRVRSRTRRSTVHKSLR